jgi:hypothetical protein
LRPWGRRDALPLRLGAVAALVFVQLGFHAPLARRAAVCLQAGERLAAGVVPDAAALRAAGPLGAGLAALGVLGGRLTGTGDVLGARLVFFVLSCATVVALYLLARDLFDSRRLGVFAALVLVGCFGFARRAAAGPDPRTPALLCEVLCLLFAVRRRWRLAGVAGVLAALGWLPAGAGGARGAIVPALFDAYATALLGLVAGAAMTLRLYGWRRVLHPSWRACLARDPFAPVLLAAPAAVLWALAWLRAPEDVYVLLPVPALGTGWLLELGVAALEPSDEGPGGAWRPGWLTVALAIGLAGLAALELRLRRPDAASARVAVERRQHAGRHAEPVEERVEPHRHRGADGMGEEAPSRDAHRRPHGDDAPQTRQPARQLDVLHERLVREPAGAREGVAPDEHGLVAVGQAGEARAHVGQVEEGCEPARTGVRDGPGPERARDDVGLRERRRHPACGVGRQRHVGVQEEEDVGGRGGGAGVQLRAAPARGGQHPDRAEPARDRHRAVGAAAVDDDRLVDARERGQLLQAAADARLLVERGHDHGEGHARAASRSWRARSARMANPAPSVPRSVPETLEAPARRRRYGTGTSA